MTETKINHRHNDNRKAHPLLDAVRQMGSRVHETDRRIELIPVVRLTACKTNARTHPPRQIRQIATSIKRFGFTVPVLVNAENEILAGHGRVEAAKLVGLAQVPVLRVNHLSAVEQRAYVVADNRLAELAGWDRDTLAIELKGLIDLDFDIAVTGFEIGEIDLTVVGTDEAGDDSAAAKNLTAAAKETCGPAVSQPGDVWMLGPHQLICGEAQDNCAYAAVDGAIRRWQTFSGNSATLAGSGATFNAIKQLQRKQSGAACAGGERMAAADAGTA
jgi:hypothetical protein